ncbi:MAG: VWA domain-containing protein [Bacilli bacterium]|nr:VWA domain-containing protein [Bacilli bacterium]
MKNNIKKLDVVFILDKSGSMSGSEDNTISSFNEYLEKERKNKFNTKITTVLFSDNYKLLHNRVDVSKVKDLTHEDYYVGGCTALYDALGNTINSFDRKETDKVLFIIITDGYENASKEFSKDKIRKLIKKHSDWEFIYIGADIDSYASGGAIGIKKDNIANYKKDARGTAKLFKAVGDFECAMMGEASTTNWKQELDDYLEENKKI